MREPCPRAPVVLPIRPAKARTSGTTSDTARSEYTPACCRTRLREGRGLAGRLAASRRSRITVMTGGTSAPSASDSDAEFLSHEHIRGLLERLRRDPALRAWVLTAPTGARATLGVVLADNELGLLRET